MWTVGKRAEQGRVGTFLPQLVMKMESFLWWELGEAHLHLRNLVAIVVASP